MLKKFFNKRITAILASVAVTASAIAGSYIFNTQDAYAKVTLRGIEDISAQHSVTAMNTNPRPFRVIEVVPTKADARFGYLVGGEEPVKDGKSIKDMPSTEERLRWLRTSKYNPTLNPADNERIDPADPSSDLIPPHDEVAYNLYQKKAFDWAEYDEPASDETNAKNMDIRGIFRLEKDHEGAYDNNDYSNAYRKYGSEDGETNVTELYGEGNIKGIKLYRHTEAFRTADDYYTGKYIFNLRRLDYDGGDTMPWMTTQDPDDATRTGNAPVENYVYSWQYFGSTLITQALAESGGITEGKYVFKCGAGANGDYLTYAGRIVLIDGQYYLEVYPYPGDTPVGGGDPAGHSLDNGIGVDDFGLDDGFGIEEDGQDSSDDGTQDSSGDGTQDSSGDGTQTPSGDGTQTPSGDGTQTPSGDGAQTPTGDGAEEPPTEGQDPSAGGESARIDNQADSSYGNVVSNNVFLSLLGVPMNSLLFSNYSFDDDVIAVLAENENPLPDDGTPAGGGEPGTGGDEPGGGEPGTGGDEPGGGEPGTGGDGPSGGEPGTGGDGPSGGELGAGGAGSGSGDLGAGGYSDPTPYDFGDLQYIALADLYADSRANDYYIVGERGTDCPNPYVIESDSIKETNQAGLYPGPFGRKRGYSEVSGNIYNSTNADINKGPYYVKTNDEDPYVYNQHEPQDGEYEFKADYTTTVYHNFKYTGGFTNNEWFKQYVLDREPGAQCDNLVVDVIPVTIDELSDYLEEANLVYFAGGRYPEDMNLGTAEKLLNMVIDDNLPVILERSVYYANLYDAGGADDLAKSERPFITLLALKLMQGTLTKWSQEDWQNACSQILGTDSWLDPGTPDTWRYVSDAIITGDNGKAYGAISGREIVTDNPAPDDTYISETKISTLRSDLLKGVMSGKYDSHPGEDCSYVQGTIFVNDDWDDDVWENKQIATVGAVKTLSKVVSGDFLDQYSEEKITRGFMAIREEYENERPIIELSSDWSQFNSAYNKATSIRYILNANNDRNAVKTQLRILDLEPMESAQYIDPSAIMAYTPTGKVSSRNMKRDNIDKAWVKENLEFTGNDENLYIKQMGTKEFIGKNEDLNVQYDMIYIGMDRIMMNTYTEGTGDARYRLQKTKYNQESMDGLVYSHVGDRFTGEYGPYNGRYASGNDITRDKLVSLTNYIQAGCAVLLSDDFFNVNPDGSLNSEAPINTTHLDISSNMYKFVKEVVLQKNGEGNYIYWGKNAFRKGALEKNLGSYLSARKTFVKYLNISKLRLIVKEKPVAYNSVDDNGDSDNKYLSKSSDGLYYLNYRVELQNDAAVNIGTSDEMTYDVKLYLDLDGDGKFEDSVDTDGDGNIDFFSDELQIGISVNDGTVLPSEDGVYQLRSGNEYTISKAVPQNYVGFLAWKLVFVQNQKQFGSNNSLSTVRTAIEGFSAVPATDTVKPEIKVLQLTPPSDEQYNTNNFILDGEKDPEMHKLYTQVYDFDIKVDSKPVDFFVTRFSNGNGNDKEYTMSYYDYLCQYDIVVIGFSDWFDFKATKRADGTIPLIYSAKNGVADSTGSPATMYCQPQDIMKDAMLAIREYALSGRSILFTHDLTFTYGWGEDNVDEHSHYPSYYLRDIMGMDRYHRLNLTDLTYSVDPFRKGTVVENYESKYDEPLLNGVNTGENYGYTDSTIVRNFASAYGVNAIEKTRTYNPVNPYVPNNRNTTYEKVTVINEGQITQYPFFIADADHPEFNVASTHNQYFQLNLDTSSFDDYTDDDVVVWLAISNKDDNSDGMTAEHEYYKALHNDVRNNYYIYSKGNIIYTGSGHSYMSAKDDGQNLDKERKLFVNTLVASYQSGQHRPDLEFKESPWDSAPTILNKYIPYDMVKENANSETTTGEWLDETIQVNFKTLNNNFRESRAELNARYYVKASAADYTLRVGTDYYKEIEPIVDGSMKNSFKVAAPDGTLLLHSTPYVLKNFSVYQATFNISDLNLGGVGGLQPKDGTTIYVHLGTEELSTGSVEALKPTEIIKGLDINVTKLFDLY